MKAAAALLLGLLLAAGCRPDRATEPPTQAPNTFYSCHYRPPAGLPGCNNP